MLACPQCQRTANLRPIDFPVTCVCGARYASPADMLAGRLAPSAAKRPPSRGPGTEFLRLTVKLGTNEKPYCNCAALRREMDELGVEGCRRERERLIADLEKNLTHYTFTEKAAGLWAAMRAGLPLSLAGLFDLAVSRAELAATN